MKKATAPKQQTVVDPLKTESGHLVVKDDHNACLMNTYFAAVGEKLARELPPLIMPLLSSDSLLQSSGVQSLSDVKLTEDSVLRHTKQMKSNKATRPDGISPKLSKSASHALSPHLTSLLDGASTNKLCMEVVDWQGRPPRSRALSTGFSVLCSGWRY